MKVDRSVIVELNARMKEVVAFLKENRVKVQSFRGCITSGGRFIDAFWVPLVEVGKDEEAKIRVYGTYYELWLIGEDGWTPVLATDNLTVLYDFLIHS